MPSDVSWPVLSVEECLAKVSLKATRKVQRRSYLQAGRFPVVDQGQDEIGGWTDDANAVIDQPLPLVVFGDHTRTLKYINFPFARGADGTQLLVPRNGINVLFFYYACRAIRLPSRGYNRHFTLLKEQTIAVPDDVGTQRSVARVLQQVEQAVRRQSVLVAKAAKLKAAAMADLFYRGVRVEEPKETEIGQVPLSWDVVAFETVREWLQYGTSVRCSVESDAYPVLRIPNIEPGRVTSADMKYCGLSPEDAERYLLRDGDLVFIRTNGVLERLGSCAVYRGDPPNALFASYLIRARLKPGVEPRFVAYFYESERGNAFVAGRATPAADGKYNLNTGTIDSLPLPLPPTQEEQREIVDVLEAIDGKIDVHRRRYDMLKDLFDSLLHKLMTGEVGVRDLDLSALPVAQEAVA